MKNYIKVFLWTVLIFTFSLSVFSSTSTAQAQATVSATTIDGLRLLYTDDEPAWMYIPSINLISSVQGMGIDRKGNMDVPPGNTNDVGWWKYGTKPGETGTAVFDAHNTAAFKNLHQVKPGSDIYVYTTRGNVLHFAVKEAETHSMSVLRPEHLFEKTSSKQINLITCAGTLLGNGEATHRLIVSAELHENLSLTIGGTISSTI